MICSVCGGTFADDAIKCPYCGTMHLPGATTAYNQKFEDMTDHLAQMGETQEDEYNQYLKKTIYKESKHWGIYIAAAALIWLLFLYSIYQTWKVDLRQEEAFNDTYKQELIWQVETQLFLDELYDAGDFDAILSYVDTLSGLEKTTLTTSNWSHSDFLDFYSDYHDHMQIAAGLGDLPTITNSHYSSMLDFYFDHRFESANYSYLHYTVQDRVHIDECLVSLAAVLEENIGLGQEELDALYPVLRGDAEEISSLTCADYINELLA
ncbi:MAG: hypothetical protein R3Y06_10130 [Faecalibacterium sp.]